MNDAVELYIMLAAFGMFVWLIFAGCCYSDSDMDEDNARLFLLALVVIWTWPVSLPLAALAYIVWILSKVVYRALPKRAEAICDICMKRGTVYYYYTFDAVTNRGAKRRLRKHERKVHNHE